MIVHTTAPMLRTLLRVDQENRPFIIRYTGKVRKGKMQDHTAFFTALDRYAQEHENAEEKLRIEFYGPRLTAGEEEELLGGYPNARKICHFQDSVDWAEALRLQETADALVLFSQPNSKGILTGKVFEYLRTLNPIVVCPGDGGELDDMLESSGLGVIGSRAEVVYQFLLTATGGAAEELKIQPDRAFIERFSRKRLCGQLANLLNMLVSNNQRSGLV